MNMKKKTVVRAPVALETQMAKPHEPMLEAFWIFDATGNGVCHWRVRATQNDAPRPVQA